MENPKFELDGKFYELVDGVPVEVAMATEEETEEVVEASEEVVLEEDKEKEEEMMEPKEDEKEEELNEEETEVVEAEVNPEVDADAVLAIVAPALDALRNEILEALADKQVEEEEEVVEEEMAEVKLSITEKMGAVMTAFRNMNY